MVSPAPSCGSPRLMRRGLCVAPFAWTAGPPGETFELTSNRDSEKVPTKSPARVQSKDRDMGSALRSAYQKTIEEEVPNEMLDLLSKLD